MQHQFFLSHSKPTGGTPLTKSYYFAKFGETLQIALDENSSSNAKLNQAGHIQTIYMVLTVLRLMPVCRAGAHNFQNFAAT